MNPHNDFDSPSPSRGSAELDPPPKHGTSGLPWPIIAVLVCIAGYWVYQVTRPREPHDANARLHELQAELIRQKADCQAEAVEFPGLPALHAVCAEQTRVLAQGVQDEAKRLQDSKPIGITQ